MDPITILALVRTIIVAIMGVSNNAKAHRDICRKFSTYLEHVCQLLETIDTSKLKVDLKSLEKLEFLLRESYDLIVSFQRQSLLDLLVGGGNANRLREKQSEIERYVNLIHFSISVAQEKERVENKEREEQEKLKAMNLYKALLKENITHYEASWTVYGPYLEEKPAWRAAKFHLDPTTQHRLFREHLGGLYKRCVEDYLSLLDEVITLDVATKHFEDGENILSSWLEAKPLLVTRQRYKDMPKGEREKLLREHIDGLHKHCVGEYQSLLVEVITLDVATKHFKDGENILSSWLEAKPLLAKRHRYKDMPKREREKLLREHVDGLHKHCVGEYQSLLVEVITLDVATKHFEDGENILSSWSQAKPLLVTRQRYKDMPKGEREKLLREHVDGLHKLCVQDYRSLLAEVITVDAANKHRKNGNTSLASWSEGKGLLKQRQRYTRMPEKEAETLFREYVAGLKL